MHSRATALWSFAGDEFLIINETTVDTYFVPPKYSRTLKKAVNRRKHLRTGLLNLLDRDGFNETARIKIGEFLAHPEVNLLIKAAEALGKMGVRGHENEPAMVFYTAALRFSRMMQANDVEDMCSGDDEITDDRFPLSPTEHRQKRRIC